MHLPCSYSTGPLQPRPNHHTLPCTTLKIRDRISQNNLLAKTSELDCAENALSATKHTIQIRKSLIASDECKPTHCEFHVLPLS